MGTGSHVFLNGKPLSSMKKGSRAHGNRKSRVFEWETAEQYEKRIAGSYNRKSRVLGGETAEQSKKSIVGSGGSKTAEKTRAQSPKSNVSSGGGP